MPQAPPTTDRLVSHPGEAVDPCRPKSDHELARDAVAPTELFRAVGAHVLAAKHRRDPPALLEIIDEHGVTLDRHVGERRLGILDNDDGLRVRTKIPAP